MDRKIVWGVIGTGFAAVEFAEGLKLVPGAAIGAVASQSDARSRRFSQRFGIPRSYADYRAIFADVQVDAIYVASLNQWHAEHCKAALAAGKAVLCEKPFALNAVEATEVIQMARAKSLFCMEAMRTAFLRTTVRSARIVRAGELGNISMLQASIGHNVPFDAGGRFYNPALGGGALLEIGCYPLAFAVALLGRPDSVAAKMTFAASGVDESVAALLHYRNGAIASISATLRSQHLPDSWIAGSLGSLRVHGPIYSSDRVSLDLQAAGAWPASDVLDAPPPPGRMARIKRSRPMQRLKPVLSAAQREAKLEYLPPAGNGFTDEIAEAVHCIRGGKSESAVHPLEHTLIAMEISDEIRKQCASQ